MRDLHLLNTFWVYIVPAFGGAFNMLIIKLFVEGIPTEIIESADLDGASEMQKMLHIAVPLLVPTLCALGLFAAVGHWNSWFDAMLYTRDANLKTIQFVIRELLLSSGSVTATNSAGGRGVDPDPLRLSVPAKILHLRHVHRLCQGLSIHTQ